MQVIGIDPGINNCSVACISDKKGILFAELIVNPYKDNGPVEKLLKAELMSREIAAFLYNLPYVDKAAVEASTASSDGLKNYNTMCRMALVSGAAYAGVNAGKTIYIPPNKWKAVSNKQENHELMLSKMSKKLKAQVEKEIKKVRNGLQHNVLDAIGIALWLLKQRSI